MDTHVLMWIHDGLVDRLSEKARKAIEAGRLFVSPMTELELEYLHEIGRIRPRAERVIRVLSDEVGLKRSDPSFQKVVAKARDLSWTRDPFDRLLVGEVISVEGCLVTKDEEIRKHFRQAVW